MLVWIIVKSALKSLLANKLRSFLAMLGIIIGVGAVIAMLAIGAGAQASIMERLNALGADNLIVRSGQNRRFSRRQLRRRPEPDSGRRRSPGKLLPEHKAGRAGCHGPCPGCLFQSQHQYDDTRHHGHLPVHPKFCTGTRAFIYRGRG